MKKTLKAEKLSNDQIKKILGGGISMTSDFGTTPGYRDAEGKDSWPPKKK